MFLDQSKKDELPKGINNLIATEFPWCKEQIIKSREFVPIEDAELWMRYKNVMDRLLLVQRGINFGEFLSPNVTTQVLKPLFRELYYTGTTRDIRDTVTKLRI